MSLNGKTVLFFAGPLYEDLELWYPKIRLEEEGAKTVVAGTGEKTKLLQLTVMRQSSALSPQSSARNRASSVATA
jgi:hypothetical protein